MLVDSSFSTSRPEIQAMQEAARPFLLAAVALPIQALYLSYITPTSDKRFTEMSYAVGLASYLTGISTLADPYRGAKAYPLAPLLPILGMLQIQASVQRTFHQAYCLPPDDRIRNVLCDFLFFFPEETRPFNETLIIP